MIHKVFSKRLNREVWAINVTVAGQRVRRSGFRTKDEARDAIAALRVRQRAEFYGMPVKAQQITLGELLAARANDPICQSTRNRRRLVGYFREFVEKAGAKLQVRDVSVSRLREFRESLLAKHKPSSVEFKMAGITGSLNAARLYFPDLETFRAPTLPSLVVESRSTLVPRAELRTLVDWLRLPNAHFEKSRRVAADVLELLQLTGARVSEICSLTPAQVDFDRRLLTLYGSKTHSKRTLPLSDSMEAILRRRSTFPPYTNIRQVVRVASLRTGVAIGSKSWVIHDIRHTAASVMAEAGINTILIANVLGHRHGGMTEKYTHATLTGLREAVNVLERYWTGNARKLHVVA